MERGIANLKFPSKFADTFWHFQYISQFFEIEVNVGRIFTEPRSSEVNILPLFTEIEKNNIVLVYTHSVISITLFVAFFVFSGTAPSWIFNISASLMVAKCEFTPAILFCLGYTLFTP